MFIAHAPFGYILSVAVLKRLRCAPVPATALVGAGILGSIAPDFDLIYFYFIDGQQTHHHRYFTHWPIVWLSMLALSGCAFARRRHSGALLLLMMFSLAGFSHMILDSFASEMWWLAPFWDGYFRLIDIPSRFQPWWLNFLLHWFIAIEFCICAWALWLYRGRAVAKSLETISIAEKPHNSA